MSTARKALCLYGTDFLLAIGGGSVIDTAKAIAYGLAEPDKDVWELSRYMMETRTNIGPGGAG